MEEQPSRVRVEAIRGRAHYTRRPQPGTRVRGRIGIGDGQGRRNRVPGRTARGQDIRRGLARQGRGRLERRRRSRIHLGAARAGPSRARASEPSRSMRRMRPPRRDARAQSCRRWPTVRASRSHDFRGAYAHPLAASRAGGRHGRGVARRRRRGPPVRTPGGGRAVPAAHRPRHPRDERAHRPRSRWDGR